VPLLENVTVILIGQCKSYGVGFNGAAFLIATLIALIAAVDLAIDFADVGNLDITTSDVEPSR